MISDDVVGVCATLDLSDSENFMSRSLSRTNESWILSNDWRLISFPFFSLNICFTIIPRIKIQLKVLLHTIKSKKNAEA
jgi:hypothetical protein